MLQLQEELIKMQVLDTAVSSWPVVMKMRIRVPNDESELPGLCFNVDSSAPITSQLIRAWLDRMNGELNADQIQILGAVACFI